MAIIPFPRRPEPSRGEKTMDVRPRVHLINFLRKMAINAVFFLAPLHFLKVGFNGWQIGFIVSLYALTPLLVSFPTGWVNDRLAITRQLLAHAQSAVDLAQMRYDLGLGSIVELSQAQLNLTSAQIGVASARYDYQTQRSVLDYQIGALR